MTPNSAEALLEAAIDGLGYCEAQGEALLSSELTPRELGPKAWADKGEWLSLATAVNADKIFFVNNNPVVVFSRSKTGQKQEVRRLHNRAWCLSRPRLLFLAMPGELAVYDLAKAPPAPEQDFRQLEPLALAHSITEVTETLKHFRREEIESGRVFSAERRFERNLKTRADKALIHDLKFVRARLIAKGLCGDALKYAHALIGRSIFIRYLEDRGVLTASYFRAVARQRPDWLRLLSGPQPPGLHLEEGQSEPLYPRVLLDRDFTYALFRRLAIDFNGDMFPDVDAEFSAVQQPHLDELRDLTYGASGAQRRLFFFAYRFDIIPIELISSIYEEFYHEESGQGRPHGAYYTPPALAEFLLSKVLTEDALERSPRILDPACGSGIFLVEAFRRIVRNRTARQGRRLRFDELQKILREQIGGIDVNAEAIRVAAFSLYLAMLHYLEPSDIHEQLRRGNRLPCLVFDPERPESFNCLVAANAFDVRQLTCEETLSDRFSSDSADIVVGNPPWGSPGTDDTNSKARHLNDVALKWCADGAHPVGDRERSQTFVWRALDLLKPGGVAGLLVSSGVFLKHHRNSLSFRNRWQQRASLDLVVNFAHARQVFFSGSAIAPFAAVVFRKRANDYHAGPTEYWSAKRSRMVDGLQSVMLSGSDRHILCSDDNLSDHRLWKTLWWGGRGDVRLISHLRSLPRLETYTSPEAKGQGYIRASGGTKPPGLVNFKALPAKSFRRYGPIDPAALVKPPNEVYRAGQAELYAGLRLLIQRGIDQKGNSKGQIVARLEDQPFAFTHAINGIKLPGRTRQEHLIILGILWSSLAKYFLFLTSANWGIWHHEIELDDELLGLPIILPKDPKLALRLQAIVEALREHVPVADAQRRIFCAADTMDIKEQQRLERELDKAVFQLYGLSNEERDLVCDMCTTGLDFLYRRDESDAMKPILSSGSQPLGHTQGPLPKGQFGDYLRLFMDGWRPYLDPTTRFQLQVHTAPTTDSMLAVVFSLCDWRDCRRVPVFSKSEWDGVLCRLDKALRYRASSQIYVDGFARAVTKNCIMILKRNERRLWTKSMAREDVEATLVQAMHQ